jgi:hypothetical protein
MGVFSLIFNQVGILPVQCVYSRNVTVDTNFLRQPDKLQLTKTIATT